MQATPTGEQAERCEAQGIVSQVPANRGINNKGDGILFNRSLFVYDEKTDTFCCPGQQTLVRKQLSRKDRCVMYAVDTQVCGACWMKSRCTSSSRRWITRHLHEGALQRMERRATKELMRLRRCTVERPFAVLKHVILANARFLLRGRDGAQIEISLATMAYNLKTIARLLAGPTWRLPWRSSRSEDASGGISDKEKRCSKPGAPFTHPVLRAAFRNGLIKSGFLLLSN
jgi:hypothetical protein